MRQIAEFVREKNRTASLRFKIIFPFVALGGLLVTLALAAVTAFIVTAWLGQPVAVLGFDQTFEQPIAFPHTAHAGTVPLFNADGSPRLDANGQQLHGLGMDCTFCHRSVTSQVNAGVAPVQQCIFCHQVIGPQDSAELQKLRAAGGLDGADRSAVNWKRVHRMPDHVRFVHDTHIRYLTGNPAAIRNAPTNNTGAIAAAIAANSEVVASLVCSTCHGDVANMPQVKQVQPLKMGQCVNCHRDNGAPTDCAVCHY